MNMHLRKLQSIAKLFQLKAEFGPAQLNLYFLDRLFILTVPGRQVPRLQLCPSGQCEVIRQGAEICMKKQSSF